ncbi:hypothetical protein B0H17DRAFT_1056866 [Mycena rosella]|uniref:F-box domain-containing protein n=1 Tax=Mycena rosella TaxID=1033263 RepID=A0AAD7GHC8_MYCRO|nr:hypothetical protein B0H17DRAFT_1056866 [Mycena rosella]
MPVDGGPTLPQELIDSILNLTDKKALKACCRVARSFRHTSQKRIFSHIKLVPTPRLSRRKADLTLQEFSQILAGSPHLALNVRSALLVEGTGVGSIPWMRGDAFPAILVMLVNLTIISIDSDLWLDWRSFPPTLIKALQIAFAFPSLATIQLRNFRFARSTELVSLLQCCRNVQYLVFSRVSVAVIDNNDTGSQDTRLSVSRLELDPLLLPLLHSVTSALDLRRLRYLQTAISTIEMAAETQHFLDAIEALSHYHVRLAHHRTDTSIIDLERLSHLRTLELSISFAFETSPDDYDPLGWAGSVLATTPDPSPIHHVILNVDVEDGDLPYLFRLADLEPFLLAPRMSMLRRVTVILESFNVDFGIYGGEWEVEQAFPVLAERGMLMIKLLGVC